MKAFTIPPADSPHDSAGLAQTTSGTDPKVRDGISAVRSGLGESFDPVTSSPSSWADSKLTSSDEPSRDSARGIRRAGATLTPLEPPLYPSSQPDTEFGSNFGTRGVSVGDPVSLSGSAGVRRHLQDPTEPEDDEIAAADWLEVSHAMLDTVHAS